MKHKTPLGVRMRYFPAAFGRLCVETANEFGFDLIQCPAAFGRLCVETIGAVVIGVAAATSRLRAAVC